MTLYLLKESWLFNNKKVLTQLNNGIKDSAKGQVKFIETDIVIARSEATRQSRKIIKNSVNQNF
ncbi:MAG: hypothetical protein LN560_01125 [Rickettsia endosymbiont of Sceptobius lativentris]|nr:hypothetical protein [Rickettsia endosymbiont of Sceptobius lativentris]